MEFSKSGLTLIGAACLLLALLLAVMPAPSRRSEARVLAAGLAIAGVVAIVRALTLRPVKLNDSSLRPIGTVIHDPEVFVASIARLDREFWQWAGNRGLTIADDVQSLDVIGEHADGIYENESVLLVPAIAAHGELVGKRTGGTWLVSRTRPGQELVIARRFRPWSRRR